MGVFTQQRTEQNDTELKWFVLTPGTPCGECRRWLPQSVSASGLVPVLTLLLEVSGDALFSLQSIINPQTTLVLTVSNPLEDKMELVRRFPLGV